MPAAVTHAPPLPLRISDEEIQWAGMNGRCNKPADTCYSFWAGGALAILKKIHLIDFNANRRYLLEKTQHIIGGFGKMPGDPPGKPPLPEEVFPATRFVINTCAYRPPSFLHGPCGLGLHARAGAPKHRSGTLQQRQRARTSREARVAGR
ncbi:MAG: hypothetical protein LQ347_007075 [Umbilicaria vellea]|nr:MAG: hypothetical protein LQ347_007075 [Umbilicaria vellea]